MKSLLLVNLIFLQAESKSTPTANSKLKIKNLFIFTLNFARTPGTYLVNDKNLAFWEKYGGLSQQTPLGKEQIYNFGSFIKEKYSSFLTPEYHPKNVYVRSIDTDRSLSSISAFINGMYPDLSINASTQWSSQSDWIPIPVHTDDINDDPLFPVTGQQCPMYDYIKDLSLKSSKYLDKEKSTENFTKLMANYSGLDLPNYIDVWKVAENILCQFHHGLKFDEVADEYFEQIKDAFFFTSNFLYAESKEKAKLVAGPILNDIVKRIKYKINRSTSNELTIYSLGKAHGQFYAMTALLDLMAYPSRPFLGSSYIFELLEDDELNHFVRVVYKTNDVGMPINMTYVKIAGCEEVCPLGTFFKITADKVVENTEKACEKRTNDAGKNLIFTSKYMILFLALIINFLIEHNN